jgi:ankyrin repeat protein
MKSQQLPERANLETMLTCGFDPNAKDKDAVTALHRAAMGGRVEAVRVLLAHGASVQNLDGMFSATPLVWATEGWKHEGTHEQLAELCRAAAAPGA